MSKYAPLWEAVGGQTGQSVRLSFDEIGDILGFVLDHSFLNAKKELLDYGWQVEKVSLKAQTVLFCRINATEKGERDG